MLGMLAQAGTGGAKPPEGNGYKLWRTNPDPPSPASVGHVDFEDGQGGSPNTMHLNPEGGGASTDWEQLPDGQYYKVGGDGKRSFCFYYHPPPALVEYTYQFKWLQKPSSSGDVLPP